MNKESHQVSGDLERSTIRPLAPLRPSEAPSRTAFLESTHSSHEVELRKILRVLRTTVNAPTPNIVDAIRYQLAVLGFAYSIQSLEG